MSNKINDGGQAFPRAVQFDDAFINGHGMTLRDYFAAAALQGCLASFELTGTLDAVASKAYAYADAMLKARESK